MIVAELFVTTNKGLGGDTVHRIPFASIEEAQKAFDYTADLLEKREKRNNDLPKLLELRSITNFSAPLENVSAISLTDFAKINEHSIGMKDTFPHMFKD